MNEQRQQLVEKLKGANNILVTVRNNPSVDLLSACIGLTIVLNKLNKHATAVFSGQIPSTMEFLKPEDTLEKNTDSLRDFIIALDKSKADKLRYKVEDKVVKIFITPYKTSISQNDLDFSQGDFNVDVVVALGAHEQQELDQAITEHGRILHDAIVMSVNNTQNGNLGSINWQDNRASSLSEMVVGLVKDLAGKDKPLMDEQVATALLTGIVAETDRFSNAKTSSTTMSISADLMSAGANQQLVATKLEEPVAPALELPTVDGGGVVDVSPPKPDDGTLEITHNPEQNQDEEVENADLAFDPKQFEDTPTPKVVEPKTDIYDPEHKTPEIRPLHPHESMLPAKRDPLPAEVADMTGLGYDAEQPSGSLLTPSTDPEIEAPALDTFGQGGNNHLLLSHEGSSADATPPTPPQQPVAPPPAPELTPEPEPYVPPAPTFTPYTPPTPPQQPVAPPPAPELTPEPEPYVPPAPASVEPSHIDTHQTLTDLEKTVHSPHLEANAPAIDSIDSARDEVLKALQQAPVTTNEPIAALNAQPLGAELRPTEPQPNFELQVDPEGNLNLPQNSNIPEGPVNEPAPNPLSPADRPLDMPLPPSLNLPPPQSAPPTNRPNGSPNSPPPVPPPMMPPFGQ